jgi:hypothetical protein
VDYFTNTIIASIFGGTLILAPCLFIIYLFKIRLPVINQSILVRAVNGTLLLGSVIFISTFIATIFIEMFTAFYSGREYEQYSLSNRLLGPYWWVVWLFILPGYLLPQILWVRKFQKTIISSVIIVCIWSALSLFVKLASNPSGWHFELRYPVIEYLKQAIIYIVILSAIYFILSKRMALSLSKV